MSFSKYLLGSVAKAKALVDELSKTFKYVSVLGADVKGVRIAFLS